MSDKLVAYFSASGVTAETAEKLSEAIGTDLYEIKPKVKYTAADLDWRDLSSRSSVEMNNKEIRPEIVTGDVDISAYRIIYIGFPIWWYVAPTVINSFLEAYDFAGKRIVLFATSEVSGFGNTVDDLIQSAPGADIVAGAVLNGEITEEQINILAGADKVYSLVGPDGNKYGSLFKGILGGNDRSKVYGKLDCSRALAAIKKGSAYAEHRVFFACESDAVAAGYRPCGSCMREEYRKWKAEHENKG